MKQKTLYIGDLRPEDHKVWINQYTDDGGVRYFNIGLYVASISFVAVAGIYLYKILKK